MFDIYFVMETEMNLYKAVLTIFSFGQKEVIASITDARLTSILKQHSNHFLITDAARRHKQLIFQRFVLKLTSCHKIHVTLALSSQKLKYSLLFINRHKLSWTKDRNVFSVSSISNGVEYEHQRYFFKLFYEFDSELFSSWTQSSQNALQLRGEIGFKSLKSATDSINSSKMLCSSA